MQVVINRLGRERAELPAGRLRNRVRIPVLPVALNGREDCQAACSHPQTGLAKGVLKRGGDHISYYS